MNLDDLTTNASRAIPTNNNRTNDLNSKTEDLNKLTQPINSIRISDIENVCNNLHTGSIFKPNESAINIKYMSDVCDALIVILESNPNIPLRNVIFEGLAKIADKATTGALNRVVFFDNPVARTVVPTEIFQDITKLENTSNKARVALSLDTIERGQSEFFKLPQLEKTDYNGTTPFLTPTGRRDAYEKRLSEREALSGPPPKVQGSRHLYDLMNDLIPPKENGKLE
jgi:hypothetical protein